MNGKIMGEGSMWLKRKSKNTAQNSKALHNKLKSSQQMDTLVGVQTVITGDITFSGGLHIDGELHGDITSDDTSSLLIVGKNAKIIGNINVHRAVVNGIIVGKMYVSDHLELGEHAVIQGDVHYNLLELAVGSQIRGLLIPDSKQQTKMLEDHTNRQAHKQDIHETEISAEMSV